MDIAVRLRSALDAAVLQLLRPIVRLLLRYQVPFAAFEEMAKRAYVRSAMEDFKLSGRRPTISRASVLTGLTRKDVQRLLSRDEPPQAPDDQRNRAERVLTAWSRDPIFLNPDGSPAPLPLQGEPRSFTTLVRRYSGDMPVRAVLDEALRVGAVAWLGGEIHLAERGAYIPKHGEIEKLAILGADVAGMVRTIEHNLERGADDPRYQRRVLYDDFPASQVAAFRAVSASQAQALLESLDRWLAEHEQFGQPGEPTVRLGMGLFYFEEPMRREQAEHDDTP